MFASLTKVLPLDHIHHSQRSTESETLSDDSRPSTSSSSSASSLTYPDDGTISWPKSWVYLCTADATRDVLRRILAQSEGAGPFGVYISDTVERSIVQGWNERTCDNVQYFATTGDAVGPANSREFSSVRADHLNAFAVASFRPIISFASPNSSYTLSVVERPAVVFPPVSFTLPLISSSGVSGRRVDLTENIPTLNEWKTLWSAWDLVTLKMIPQEMLLQKPIDLRHKCLFYIGHIPTFLDMLLSKAIGGPATGPAYFWNIFERGIDPHVDDPEYCHNHSEVPEVDEDWPSLETIMGFRDGVRARLAQLYEDIESGRQVLTRNIARTLVMTLEHEGFHVETLLYMLIQRAGTGTLPPPGFMVPPWKALAEQWKNTPSPARPTVTIGSAALTMGHNDSEADDAIPEFKYEVSGHEFGWDNESPLRVVHVNAFKADWRPITNGEFMDFWQGEGKNAVSLPKSWEMVGDEVMVKTMYGPVPMEYAQHWPVLASYDDLTAFARAKGGRLPTEPELRLLLDTYDVGHEGGANVGFRNWHPIPATMGLGEGGKGSNGGVWEWTSTVIENHDGLVPTKLFPGYTNDFFDGKHQVVLGASYATIPRLCRRTVRNFYQHNYPYAWVAGRVVYDI